MHPLRLIGHQPLLLCATTHNSRVLNTSHRDALPPQQEHRPQGGQVFMCTPLRLIGRQHCSCVVQRVKHISLGCCLGAAVKTCRVAVKHRFSGAQAPSNWAPPLLLCGAESQTLCHHTQEQRVKHRSLGRTDTTTRAHTTHTTRGCTTSSTTTTEEHCRVTTSHHTRELYTGFQCIR